MSSDSLQERLRDPAYLDLHMTAVAVLRLDAASPWYDAQFLQMYEAALQYVELVRPDRLEEFRAAFAPLRTPKDFRIKEIDEVFSPDVLDRVRQEIRETPAASIKQHEAGFFGRHVVHDHPYFVTLQNELLPRVSEMAGRPLEAGYNFLSLYGNMGRCAPHLDHPISMYTLDVCVDQNIEWPIWFSDIIDWPTREFMANFDAETSLTETSFHEYVLRPNRAILFSGSGQWHYRDPMPEPGFCNLLFFHYFPEGCASLVDIGNWPDYFQMPELQPLCDLFAQQYPQGDRIRFFDRAKSSG